MSSLFPSADAVIDNEGELGFSNILRNVLGNSKTIFESPIDGVSFLDGNRVVQGRPVGLTLDLSTMGSPYLSGLMDDFMDSDYQPLIQTSRFCPYTCSFCVSGKNRGKLRGFPLEQVEAELRYVSKKYVDRPHHTVYLVDENFGILKRDVEIAEAIKKCKTDIGYPLSVFFYNDKRFTQTSRTVLEILKDMTQMGVVLALQTDDPAALKAVQRRNVTDKEIDSAIAWAKEIGLEVTTDLIFGLPYDTRDAFVKMLNHCIKRGFDSVRVFNLYMLHGSEMNRLEDRNKYAIKTKYRPLADSYGTHDRTFFAEHEEVVVATDSFTFDDFLEVRGISFLFISAFDHNFQKWFFHFITHLGISLSEFFSRFIRPDRSVDWPEGYLRFLDDFRDDIEGELHDTREEMVAKAKEIFEAQGNDVGDASRINISYSARLCYLESDWVPLVLLRHLDEMEPGLNSEIRNLAISLISLAKRERVDLREATEKNLLNFSFDIINWKENKFQESLLELKMPKTSVNFSFDENQATLIKGFQDRYASYDADKDFYNVAMETIMPRRFLLHTLTYDETPAPHL